MPELPEVQTTVNGLQKHIAGLTIADVWTDYNSLFHTGKDNIKDPVYFRHFKKHIVDAGVVRVTRQAKNILIHLSTGDVILIHMKMTGHIIYGRYIFDARGKSGGTAGAKTKNGTFRPAPDEREALHDPFNRFIHFVITFKTAKTLNAGTRQIILSDMRKFAKVTLISEKDLAVSSHLSDIGPDPLAASFSFAIFKERLYRRPSGRIKNVLMDQSVIAGIGNIYSDEALWRAGIHPEEHVKKIPDPLLKKLYTASLAVLSKGIDFGGDSMSDYRNIDGERGKYQEHHQAYRRTGDPCPKAGCKGTIIRKVVGGRSAHFCDTHQKLL